ncbi:MAG: transcription antitermination factor NusB [Eubacteriales bacterium]|nr:transcription antitermination factor NusB [Eubacteriales bacterium]
MSRRELRENIFLLLFRIEFNTREELQEQMDGFLEEKPNLSEPDESYIRTKVNAILDVLPEMDETIMRICTGWRLERLGKTELAILRLAVYEMVKDEDIPKGVAINEALELAKIYCSEDAPRFINGVLAKLA